jgi:hypothetical protein
LATPSSIAVTSAGASAPALPCAGVRSFQQRDAAGAAPYLLESHGRMADCRDRAPPATCASCGSRCDGAAAPRRCDHVSDAPGGPGSRGWATVCDRTCTGAPTRPAAHAATSAPAVSGSDLRLARRVAGRFLLSYLRFAYGRASATSVEGVTPGLRGQLMRDRAQVTPAERARHPRVVSLRVLGTNPGFGLATATVDDGGSRRIGCGLRSGKCAAGGWWAMFRRGEPRWRS